MNAQAALEASASGLPDRYCRANPLPIFPVGRDRRRRAGNWDAAAIRLLLVYWNEAVSIDRALSTKPLEEFFGTLRLRFHQGDAIVVWLRKEVQRILARKFILQLDLAQEARPRGRIPLGGVTYPAEEPEGAIRIEADVEELRRVGREFIRDGGDPQPFIRFVRDLLNEINSRGGEFDPPAQDLAGTAHQERIARDSLSEEQQADSERILAMAVDAILDEGDGSTAVPATFPRDLGPRVNAAIVLPYAAPAWLTNGPTLAMMAGFLRAPHCLQAIIGSAGYDPVSRDGMGRTLEHFVAAGGSLACLGVTGLILGEDPVDSQGWNSPDCAAMMGHCAMMMELLRHGRTFRPQGGPRAKDPAVEPMVLRKVAFAGHIEVLRSIRAICPLGLCVDPGLIAEWGSPLHAACLGGQQEVLYELLAWWVAAGGERGDLQKLVNEDGKLLQDCAVDGGCTDCVSYLSLRRVDFRETDLVRVAARGDIDMLRHLIQVEHCSASAPNKNGMTPLLSALLERHANAALWLLMNGAGPAPDVELDQRLIAALVDWHDLAMLNRFVEAIHCAPPALLEALADADWTEALEVHGPEFLGARFPDPEEDQLADVDVIVGPGRRSTHPDLKKPGWIRKHPSMYFTTFTQEVMPEVLLPPDARKEWAGTARVHNGAGSVEFDVNVAVVVIFKQKTRVEVDELPAQTMPEGSWLALSEGGMSSRTFRAAAASS
jgi:ankyrin repeat protein